MENGVLASPSPQHRSTTPSCSLLVGGSRSSPVPPIPLGAAPSCPRLHPLAPQPSPPQRGAHAPTGRHKGGDRRLYPQRPPRPRSPGSQSPHCCQFVPGRRRDSRLTAPAKQEKWAQWGAKGPALSLLPHHHLLLFFFFHAPHKKYLSQQGFLRAPRAAGQSMHWGNEESPGRGQGHLGEGLSAPSSSPPAPSAPTSSDKSLSPCPGQE